MPGEDGGTVRSVRVRVRYQKLGNAPAWFYVAQRGVLVSGPGCAARALRFTEGDARKYTARLFEDNPNLTAWRIVAEDGTVLASDVATGR